MIRKLKRAFLIYYSWVPLNWSKKGVDILIDDPRDLRKTDYIKALVANSEINYSVGIREDIVRFIDHFFGTKKKDPEEDLLNQIDTLIPQISFDEVEEEEDDLIDVFDESSSQVVRYVDQVLITAYRDSASDIHFEPSPITGKTTIRFRIDGICHEYMQIPNAMISGVISRLKIMAGLDIAERRLPQDRQNQDAAKRHSPFRVANVHHAHCGRLRRRGFENTGPGRRYEARRRGAFGKKLQNIQESHFQTLRDRTGCRSHRFGKNHDASRPPWVT